MNAANTMGEGEKADWKTMYHAPPGQCKQIDHIFLSIEMQSVLGCHTRTKFRSTDHFPTWSIASVGRQAPQSENNLPRTKSLKEWGPDGQDAEESYKQLMVQNFLQGHPHQDLRRSIRVFSFRSLRIQWLKMLNRLDTIHLLRS